MDLRQLLGKLDLLEGTMVQAEKHPTGPKFTGKWKGTDAGTPGRTLVGDSIEPEESILKDLSKGPTPKTREQELAEQFEQFLQALEEDNLGVEEKRPARKGSRPGRDYGKTGEQSKRYTYNSEETDESRGHKIVTTKLKDIERAKKPTADVDLKSREAQARADYAKYVAKMKKLNPNYVPIYKMDETDTVPTGQQTMADKTGASTTLQADPKQVAATNQALQAMKAGTGSSAPTTNIAKALDAASQGKPVGQQDMQALEPLMKDMATVAQDPKLAGQFKTLAQQVQQKQQQQK
jgi:hypothetical protein